ncbi:TSUP family transporter [Vulcanococcus sp.]|uniref:TSUP family transporter n=1 Tax=Vulcanococcus sp. TaxID=2856995 RepID=UPI003F695908
MPWDLLPLLPLGLLAGLLSGLLGIGGGLVFSPLLLAMGLTPHQALATSTLAILPTTMSGSWAHLRSGQVPPRAVLAIAAGAIAGAMVFSRAGDGLQGWHLLSLQALMYGVLALVISPRRSDSADADVRLPLPGLTAVGLVAGWSSGLLGVGGGLVMVPLMVQGLKIRVYQAIRLSTIAVCASAATAAITFTGDGRGNLGMGFLLGGAAAVAAQWSASRLQSVSETKLVWLLRALCALLALDAGRRAVQLALSA